MPKTSAPIPALGIMSRAAPTDSACPLCRTRFHSSQVVQNFALQHVVAEGPGGMAGAVGGGAALDVRRGSSNADVAAIYRESGVPPQLAQVLAEEDHSIALRVYILDDSGSMNAGDGSILEHDPRTGHFAVRRASRWDELKHMTMEQARWNAKIGVPSEFLMLNAPNPMNPKEGTDLVRIDAQTGSTDVQVANLQAFLERQSPRHSTPLTQSLQNLRKRLHATAPELREKGRKLMLILVTDGVPNGSKAEFVAAIRLLGNELPVHIVVRLCTNEENVSEFYDEVDKELELSLDILDDFQGEAKNIYYYNPWLTYPHILHTVREAGSLSKLLDFIDERALTPMEVGLCAQLLLRVEGQTKYPWQPEELLQAVEKDLASAPSVFCMRRRAISPILNVQALRPAILPGKHSLTGQVASAVGLGGVAEAWYEGRTLLDAFQYPKVTQTASVPGAAAGHCALCTRTTDGSFAHCCRTCEKSGGEQHGPSCERRNRPPPVEPAGGRKILQLGAVPAGCCFLCARGTDGVFPHCCRTCEQSGGTRHGPACESRHAVAGYPQARKGGKGPDAAKGGQSGKNGYGGKGDSANATNANDKGGKGAKAAKGDQSRKAGHCGKGDNAENATDATDVGLSAGYRQCLHK